MKTIDRQTGFLERRKFPRIKDYILVLGSLKCKNVPAGIKHGKEFKAIASNISAGGLEIETEVNIPLKSRLRLEILQPIKRDKSMIFSICATAVSVCIREMKSGYHGEGANRYKVGIRFIEIKEGDRQMIVRYVGRSMPLISASADVSRT